MSIELNSNPVSDKASRLVVTTSTGNRPNLIQKAKELAAEFKAPFFLRQKRGLSAAFNATQTDHALIVENSGLALAHKDGTFYRYHPNLGMLRALNLLRGQRDIFADAVSLNTGDSILDCTIGFASEAIIASLIVGETGRVVGLESSPVLALVTKSGLRDRPMLQDELIGPMRRIEVRCADYRNEIVRIGDDGFDVIYFDPFFHARIDGSQINIDPLMKFGNPAPLDASSIKIAIQKARKRVVLKHPKGEILPDGLGEMRTEIVRALHGPIEYSVFGCVL